ncbi:M20/M25/M40 family metallo-hydrolase [Granulicella cerasi]|uniref:M20/M25/M40 family metallo-hydrolase n=1 Tax=Granulicella cerasi TaxID=741063 RepID=A0ABW1Z440_9BACT|nr:M20/M25/M40 family metallo-hydrolase [Granulicella cerasi]
MTNSAANRRITTLAGQRAVHAAFGWLHLHEPQVRRWQRELVAIPAPTFHEQARAAWFADRFRDLGLADVHVDEAGNALAELPGASEQCVLLSAHLDTVFDADTPIVPTEEEDGTLHAPGATDNAAGLAALLALAAALKHSQIQPAATILFAANVGEEGHGDLRGMRHLFGPSPYAPRIRSAIALEGAGTSTVIDRALGSRRLRISLTGPGGHSWADSHRPNPIVALAELIVELQRLSLPATPRTTLNIGTILGGSTVNSIPAEASADLDLRSASAHELNRLEMSVLKHLSGVIARWPDLSISAERIGDRPAGELAANSALATSLRAVDRHLSLQPDSRLGSTDANLPLSVGIPALAIGAGGQGGGIHTTGEWFTPANRTLALRRILLLLLDTCALVGAAE